MTGLFEKLLEAVHDYYDEQEDKPVQVADLEQRIGELVTENKKLWAIIKDERAMNEKLAERAALAETALAGYERVTEAIKRELKAEEGI